MPSSAAPKVPLYNSWQSSIALFTCLLLLLLMTLFFGVAQADAMAINLLYFLPTAAMGLLYHRKNGLLDRAVLRSAAPWGTAAAAAGALAATAVDTDLLRRPFGIYLLLAAGSLLLRTKKTGKT